MLIPNHVRKGSETSKVILIEKREIDSSLRIEANVLLTPIHLFYPQVCFAIQFGLALKSVAPSIFRAKPPPQALLHKTALYGFFVRG